MRLFLLCILFFLPWVLPAQLSRCLAEIHLDNNKDTAAFETYRSLVQNSISQTFIRNRSLVYVPVVIHVVAYDQVQPVSVTQAIQQIDVLNADFAGRGENISKLLDAFVPLVGNAEIQFCLATTDPDGQPTSGITFTQTDIEDIALETGDGGRKAIHWDQLGGKTGWDPTRYLNIWIGEYGSVLGSASFPGMADYSEEIGVVIDPKYFGSVGDAGQSGFYGRGHTLTHEMGHFFGLQHIWGNDTDTTCDDTDFIDDTPNAAGPYYDCPSGNHMSCGNDNMYQNFMDFTDDRCLAAFTKGQVTFMQSVIETFYPGLMTESDCTTSTGSFDTWYEQLTWAFDSGSNTYVIYNQDTWQAVKKVLLYSVDGKLMLEDTWEGEWSYLLDLGHVPAGIYIVSIEDGEQRKVKKVVAY